MFVCNFCRQRLLRSCTPRASALSASSAYPSRHAATLTDVAKSESNLQRPPIHYHYAADKSTDEHRIAIDRELKWLADPLKLADRVTALVKENQVEKAEQLCRQASSRMDCVVAWNRLVDHYMQGGHVKTALKTFNEMKKRAQFPDKYTYTIILRALSPPPGQLLPPQVADANATRAVSLYNSMTAPNSRVKPSLIHTNATLRACAFASNLDAFWGILGKLPASGPNSADHRTYTLILDAIRHDATAMLPDTTAVQRHMKRSQAAAHGRQIWQEVVSRWRQGYIHIDAVLVGSMARLLLISESIKDWDDVLSLIQQTMQIKRLIQPVGSSQRQIAHVPDAEPPINMSLTDQKQAEETADMPITKVFHPLAEPDSQELDVTTPSSKSRLAYVEPTNDTLSVLMDACSLMRIPKSAWAYWNLLITQYNIIPDLPNLHSQLRILSRSRSSERVVNLLSNLLTDPTKRRDLSPNALTFRLAMEACMRDKNNPHAPAHAETILSLMNQALAIPDPAVLEACISLPLLLNNDANIRAALDRLYPHVDVVREQFLIRPKGSFLSPAATRRKNAAVLFLKNLVSAIDKLMRKGVFKETDDEKIWGERRVKLCAAIGLAMNPAQGRAERVMLAGGDKARRV
ncbi:hypothetical protein K470DRAFT_282778 [Piedraia hortae CBS 480.64]|uniref:Pentatricopeptide repeat protein n=1 Tax=Piedraia hortae CBS 480.64 TaxID=1314780 RepID=A0A6A7BVQ9_9PEZI|nr:hypothetical protein K470DRAFT_282778 [Piedraia hortae CBS 480.64]